ncbi:LysR substrate-binding domain-containing protein [Vibrio sp. WXL210]|uniref:LysR family transcriptional regulator n=1 Tax=Vibrio sp. WXL210 TaxID=3450709 RepID=UPI003EC8F8B7
MLNSNQILLFVDVVQQGSFSKAAALHEMDNSSLSKQIKRLESDLGVQLLNRSTRSFSLTSAGEEIFQYGQALRDTLQEIQLSADAYQERPKGVLRITSPSYFGHQYLQPVITEFMRAHPDVQIHHSLDDRKSDIISDHYDLAFRLSKLSDSSLIAKTIAKSHFILVAANCFVEEYGMPTSPKALNVLPAVIYSNQEVTLDTFTISETANGEDFQEYKMQGRYRVNDVRTLIEAVRDGVGYARIDASNLFRPLSELGLVQLLPNHRIISGDKAIYALYPHRKQTPLVRSFISAVEAHIGNPPRWLEYIEGKT